MTYKYILIILIIALSLYCAGHALLNKRDSRAAFGWIDVCLFLPILGPLIYFIFGVNRVQKRARKLRLSYSDQKSVPQSPSASSTITSEISQTLINTQTVSNRITGLPLVCIDKIETFYSGHDTYTSMLNAIHAAQEYIYLCVYIFKTDEIGLKFIQALTDAKNRGVSVYVLIDGIGEKYSWRKARTLLRNNNICVRTFFPPRLIPFNLNINLRNHRKLLIIDDEISYVGGINIDAEYSHHISHHREAMVDTHFKMQGDITHQLKALFEADWLVSGGNILTNGSDDLTDTHSEILCRVIADGPGINIDHLSTVLITAINSAIKHIVMMTPYFIPSRELIGAIRAAAMRGVNVEIILPQKSNLRYVDWASRNMLWELLERDINIYYQPGPFAHSKLFVVDYEFSLVGSANIDPRSLRLNYEVGVEVYNKAFANELNDYMQLTIEKSTRVTLEDVDNRSLAQKIRDGIAWLFSPYL